MLALIWAQADGGVIGKDGAIPWRLPEDQARFKALTTGSAVLMGRLTWESLPASVRPLPGRRNLVLTTAADWTATGAERVASVEAAASLAAADLWVIGGERVYQAALPLAGRAVVTQVDASFDGDTFAPELDASWHPVDVDPPAGWHVSSTGLRFKVTTFERAGAVPSSA
jgi:dihydrofolate reductase